MLFKLCLGISNEFCLFIVYRDVMIVLVINCSISVFVGFVIFSVLGFMVYVFGKEVKDVVIFGFGLVFVVYFEGIV